MVSPEPPSVAELGARSADRAAAAARARVTVQELRGVGTSEGGWVEAEVDGHGRLVGLWLAPGATRLDPTELASHVVTASEAAAGWVSQRREAIMALAQGDALSDAWDRLAGRPPRT